MARIDLKTVVRRLQAAHGEPVRPPVSDVFGLIVWEIAVYLVSDERRRAVFEALEREVGVTPEAILAAPRDTLVETIRDGGMLGEHRAAKLVEAAELAIAIGDGFESVLGLPTAQAKKILQRFPGIGEPGAEKLLLFTRGERVLAPDSNGLRVLQRLGFCSEGKDYRASYRAARDAVAEKLPDDDPAWLVEAHLLLRIHGKELCKNTKPKCEACPMNDDCPSAAMLDSV